MQSSFRSDEENKSGMNRYSISVAAVCLAYAAAAARMREALSSSPFFSGYAYWPIVAFVLFGLAHFILLRSSANEARAPLFLDELSLLFFPAFLIVARFVADPVLRERLFEASFAFTIFLKGGILILPMFSRPLRRAR